MLNIILYQPQIPPNTGNVIRLTANTGITLHLVRPFGFKINEKSLQRAGLDYHDMARVRIHNSLEACLKVLNAARLFAVTKYGQLNYTEADFRRNDAILFGSETSGLPLEILQTFETKKTLYIPMVPNNRSLNLSNAVAIVLYEAWRKIGFPKTKLY